MVQVVQATLEKSSREAYLNHLLHLMNKCVEVSDRPCVQLSAGLLCLIKGTNKQSIMSALMVRRMVQASRQR